jgi:hypothetical protein
MASARGAYGLRLPGISDINALVSAPAAWSEWTFKTTREPFAGPMSWGDSLAELRTLPSGTARIDRHAQATVLHLPSDISEAALLHPYLGTTAVSVAAWKGICTFHGGSFVLDGGVWGLLGDREDGKSSTLAWLAQHGFAIFGDDLLVTDGRIAMAGPRFIDLRRGASERFGIGADVGVLGTRRRWRVALDPIEAELPFRGWVQLSWGPKTSLEPVPMDERVGRLAGHRGLRLPIPEGESMLRVLGRPALRFCRPKEWGALDASMAELLDGLAQV